MQSPRKGITVAGSLVADIFHQIDTYPGEGLLTTVRGMSQSIGGSGNIIIDLAKLDKELTVKVSSIVGDDKAGKGLLDVLNSYPNINTENVTVEGNSTCTLVMNAQDTMQRTFFFIPEASDRYDESYIDWDKIDSKIFQLEYLLLMKKVDAPDSVYGTHGAKILHDAKERGLITSIDIVSEKSSRAAAVIKAALKYTDICCINEFETELVTEIPLVVDGKLSEENVRLATEKMRELGVSKWVVIHSPAVGYGFNCATGEFVRVPSLKLPEGYIKGTTGAGDAYCSGILYGAHQDMSLFDSMRLARATAACSLSENNGTDGSRSYEESMLLEEKFGVLD